MFWESFALDVFKAQNEQQEDALRVAQKPLIIAIVFQIVDGNQVAKEIEEAVNACF